MNTMILVQMTHVRNKMMYKFCAETFVIASAYSLSMIAIHILITVIFHFSYQDSIIILIPVFLISFPALIYGYYIGVRQYWSTSGKTINFSKERAVNKRLIAISKASMTIFLIFLSTFIGMHLIIIDRSYYIGVVISTLGAVLSIPVSKNLYLSLIQ